MAGSRSNSLMSMSRRDADDLYSSMRDANRYIASERDPKTSAKSKTTVAVEALEVAAGAAAVGWSATRLGTTAIPGTGIPLGLTAAAALHTLAYFNVLPSASDHLHNLGNGALAGWVTMWAAGQGANARSKAGLPVASVIAGEGRMSAIGGAPPAWSAPQQLPSPAPSFSSISGSSISGSSIAGSVPRSPLTEAELQAIAANMRR